MPIDVTEVAERYMGIKALGIFLWAILSAWLFFFFFVAVEEFLDVLFLLRMHTRKIVLGGVVVFLLGVSLALVWVGLRGWLLAGSILASVEFIIYVLALCMVIVNKIQRNIGNADGE